MRKTLRLAAMEWSMMLQYRTDVLLWTAAEAVTPLITLAIWYRISQQTSSALTSQETITYFLGVVFLTIVTGAWGGFFLANDILTGKIVQYLIRPLSIFWHHIEQNILEKILKLFIPLPVVILCLYFFPEWFSPKIFIPSHILLFIPSVLLAIVLAFVLDIALGTLAFWLENANQIRGYRYMLETVMSGKLIPYTALPAAVFTAFSWFPFRYIISAPLEILLGQAEGSQAWKLLGYQSAWLLALLLILIILWKKGLKRYAIPGQ